MDPTVNAGAYTPEEISDFGDAKTVSISSDPAMTAGPVRTDAPVTPPPPATPTPASVPAQPLSAPPAASSVQQEPAASGGKPETVIPEVVNDDPTKCPAGKQQGKKWEELSDAQLAAAAKWNHPTMTDKHRAKVREVILTRSNKPQ